MSYDFPASPSVGTLFAPASGPTWQWNGTTWLSVAPSGLVPEAPTDGQNYVRRNGLWVLAPGTAEAKNRIVNPAMQISQERGDTATTTINSYVIDQWATVWAAPAVLTCQRVQVPTPNGSRNRLRVTVTTADTSMGTADETEIYQPIEGIRVADFGWGAAGARQIVVRFGWKSPAGTYSVALYNSALNRSYVANFTISAGQANTDTTQTMVVPGDTTGVWLTDIGIGMGINFNIACGSNGIGVAGWQAGYKTATSSSTNGTATAGAIFELFDVGLHLDPQNTGVAPPWTMPDEAEELRACQRYYWRDATGRAMFAQLQDFTFRVNNGLHPVPMRTFPAVSGTLSLGTPAFTGSLMVYQVSTSGLAAGSGCNLTLIIANARM